MQRGDGLKAKFLRIVLWIVGIVVGLTAVALIAFNFYMGSSKPIIEGRANGFRTR